MFTGASCAGGKGIWWLSRGEGRHDLPGQNPCRDTALPPELRGHNWGFDPGSGEGARGYREGVPGADQDPGGGEGLSVLLRLVRFATF